MDTPEIMRTMRQLGEVVTEDPYDIDVPQDEETGFVQELAEIDEITSFDY